MDTIRLYMKRSTISLIVAIQVLFFPSMVHADTATTPTDSSTPATTSQPATEAAPDPSSGTTPDGSTSTTPPADPAPTSADPTTTTTNTSDTTQPPAASDTLNPPTPTTNTTSGTTSDTSGTINNTITNTSTSGDAEVGINRVAGNATSGNALAIQNLLNMLQSQSNVLGGNAALQTFTADITGDVVGDLMIDPSQLSSLQASILNASDVHITNNGSINNNVGVDATSGNATVHDNRVAGDATTGNADAVVNLVNMLNSVINAGGSFFGVINIYGDLQGDILLPPDVLAHAIADNSIPTATISIDSNNQSNTTLQNNQAINNQITTTAASGTANVADNRVGGNATTGTAKTNITVLNLTSHQVVGANTLLVFVNVLGQWVGVLMDAPAGSTAAAIGGGVTADVTQSNVNNTDLSNTQKINNQINVNAQSGNADVNTNRVAGNATSGNATASANVANIENSTFSLSNWFGILFINVFGKWNGSFGVDTAAGGFSTSSPPPTTSQTAGATAPQVFQFVPSSGSGGYHLSRAHFSGLSGGTTPDTSLPSDPTTDLLGSATTTSATTNPLTHPSVVKKNSSNSSSSSSWLITSLGVILGIGLLGGERIITSARRRF